MQCRFYSRRIQLSSMNFFTFGSNIENLKVFFKALGYIFSTTYSLKSEILKSKKKLKIYFRIDFES
jgi:hypothetical protein